MTICYHWLCWISLLDFGCHAVDDNNNNHQGWLSFEESFTFDYWDLRQFGFIVTISHVHTMLANNYFCCSHGSNSIYNKTTLTRELASLSIFGSEDFEDIQCLSGGTIREQSKQIATKRIVRAIFIWKSFGVDENPAHWLCHPDTSCGRWNGIEFPMVNTTYSCCGCTMQCVREWRTHFSANGHSWHVVNAMGRM